MLKRLFGGLFALTFATINLSSLASPATSAANLPVIIDNVLDLCNAMLSNGNWLDDSGTCNAYSGDQISATISRVVYVSGNWVLKDLDLTFTRSNSPFTILSGSLTIEGGHYTSPSCVVWIQYRDGEYTPSTYVTINSGVFEASVETVNSTDSPSPVCLITPDTITPDETQGIIAGYLPEGKHFVDIAPRLRMRSAAVAKAPKEYSIDADSGYAHIDKDAEIRTEVKYLKTTLVEVVGEPAESSEEPNETDNEEKGIEQEEAGRGSVENEKAESDLHEPSLPKVPNTGVPK